jgi:hypothetical protein
MLPRIVFLSAGLPLAIAVVGSPAMATTMHQCTATATVARDTQHSEGVAVQIFKEIQFDVEQARVHADQLQTYALHPGLSWQAHGEQLVEIKDRVNEIGNKLCQLEEMRPSAARWQQKEIDTIARDLLLMADNTSDAIRYLNEHHREDTLSGNYQTYASNLYKETRELDNSVGKALTYSRVSQEYRHLRKEVSPGPTT